MQRTLEVGSAHSYLRAERANSLSRIDEWRGFLFRAGLRLSAIKESIVLDKECCDEVALRRSECKTRGV